MKAFGVFLLACATLGGAPASAQLMGPDKERKQAPYTAQQTLSVLHWWTSDSERQAVDQLRGQLAMAGVQWQDAAIPGGGGVAAFNVLNSRLLSGAPPDVAQLVGATLTEWAEFDAVARSLSASGIKPLAWSDQAWQISTVFDSLLLSEGGAALHRELIGQYKSADWMDDRVRQALLRLRVLRSHSGDTPSERAWTAVTDDLLQGRAAMLIMGDWAKGELMAWGASLQSDIGCVAVPGTAGMHLYGIDTLVMLRNKRQHSAVQEKFAETVSGTAAQRAYNRVKGSVPVLLQLSAAQLRSLDACARESWQTFASQLAIRLPNLGMVTDKATRDAVKQTLWHYVNEPDLDVAEVQRQLASIFQQPTHRTSP